MGFDGDLMLISREFSSKHGDFSWQILDWNWQGNDRRMFFRWATDWRRHGS